MGARDLGSPGSVLNELSTRWGKEEKEQSGMFITSGR
jgi:hypothetical protein